MRPIEHGVLAGAARLFFVLVVEFRLARRRLRLGDARFTHEALHLVFAADAFDVNFEV